MSDPLDERLDRALRDLPRTEARPGFRGRVQERARDLDKRGTSWLPIRPLWLATAAVVVIVAVPSLRWGLRPDPTRHHGPVVVAEAGEQQRVRELRDEYAELQRELEELRRLASAKRPVVGVEGAENDYLIDLRNLYTTGARDARGGATPASYRTPPRPR